jgi:hypothetical protein
MSGPLLPPAAAPFVTFAALLRANGFAVAPDQTMTFLTAIALLGPRSIADVRRAAHAALAPPPERRALFDALFDAHFLGLALPALASQIGDEAPVRVQEQDDGGVVPPEGDDLGESGDAATATEALSRRTLRLVDDDAALRRFRRRLPAALPRRRGYRFAAARTGGGIDLRRLLRTAARNDGEVVRLPRRDRVTRQRTLLVLIDVSGSMKTLSEDNLAVTHALVQGAERCEVFTFGTRLTRITRALKLKSRAQALTVASETVSDWDGGTRIGDSLAAFLAVPRFAGYARGALVVVVSDGLERGDHAAMVSAVARLAARAWRLEWLTPLAATPGFVPRTEALKAILPHLDRLGPAGSVTHLTASLLESRGGRAA